MTDPIRRIEDALAGLGAEHEPPRGWEARVLAATTARRRRPWWIYAAPGLVAAAAAVLLYLGRPREPAALALDVDLEHSVASRGGGGEGRVGDVVHVTVRGGSGRVLWIYRDDVELVMRCPGDPACRVSEQAIRADLVLGRVGTYRMVALTAGPAVPAPAGSYEADVAAARRAGVSDVREHSVNVP